MAFTLNRNCIACRRLIPINPESPSEVVIITTASLEYKEKTGKLNAKIKAGPLDGLCSTCSEKMLNLITAQKEKGLKVL